MLLTANVQATDRAVPETQSERPAIRSNRWQEDWSVLADQALRTQPLDSLKYLPLQRNDPASYLSLGLAWRERLETIDAPAFGTRGQTGRDTYLLQRVQVHADVHFNARWRFFAQIEDVRSFGKGDPSPTDRNPLDLRLAFLSYTTSLASGTLMARFGRQDFAFEQQRFLSLRDGPNVRQSFDAAWLHYERGSWEISGFLSQPVQYDSQEPFDDISNRHLRFHLLRAERHGRGDHSLSFFYARYDADDAQYLDASGREQRNVLDVRLAGSGKSWDWDVEGMVQGGDVGSADVRAWALGARAGFTLADHVWTPRLGIQVDAASGDKRAGDVRVETFNPLFPNGSYSFSLAGNTGYVNLIQVKPSLTLYPNEGLEVAASLGLLWRQTTADAVYLQPDIPVAGTAGLPDHKTGAYAQLRADWQLNPNLSSAMELVRYDVGDTLRRAGGRNSDYVGVELKFVW
jgi:hypothetical protein